MRTQTETPEKVAAWEDILHRRYRVYLRDVFRDRPGTLLDVGSGYADILVRYLRERSFTYYCLDVYEDVVQHMSRLLQSQGVDTYARQGQIESLPFPDRFFDVVYASHILEHTIDIDRTLAEVRRVLKRDGYLVFAVPCGHDDDPAHTHNRERPGWIEDLTRNGFTIEVSGQFDFNMNEFYGRAIVRQLQRG